MYRVGNKINRKEASSSSLSQYGISLSRAALRGLEKRGIYCQTSISVEHQHLANRFVLRGIESGGAVSDMARYCAFLNCDGKPIPWLQSLDSISGNGRHAVIVAPEFLRLEMFRVGRTYELAITRHSLIQEPGSRRPRAVGALVFRGREGTIGLNLWERHNHTLRGTIAPTFFSDAGEARSIPTHLFDAVKSATAALNCLACKHTHIATARGA